MSVHAFCDVGSGATCEACEVECSCVATHLAEDGEMVMLCDDCYEALT
jgi:hypothetical protein